MNQSQSRSDLPRRDVLSLLGGTAAAAALAACDADQPEVSATTPRGSVILPDVAADMAALRCLAIGPKAVQLQEHTVGYGGGGVFVWDANSTAAHNGGTVIHPWDQNGNCNAGTLRAGAGRWLRLACDAGERALDIRWFGAKDDGSADAGGAFEDALGALPSTGGRIYVPRGTYRVDSPIHIDTDGVEVVGDGSAVSIIQAGTYSLDTLFAVVQNTTDVRITGMTLRGASDGVTPQTHTGITVNTTSTSNTSPSLNEYDARIRIDDIVFDEGTGAGQGGWAVGCRANRANEVTMTACTVRNTFGTGTDFGHGISASTDRSMICENTFENSTTDGRHPIYLNFTSRECLVEGNDIEGFSNLGITLISHLEEGGGHRVLDNSLLDSNSSGSSGQIDFGQHDPAGFGGPLDPDPGYATGGCVIRGNAMSGGGNIGVHLRGWPAMVVADNDVGVGPGEHGIRLGSYEGYPVACEGSIVADCAVTGLDKGADNPVGIELANSDYVLAVCNSTDGDDYRAGLRFNEGIPKPTNSAFLGNTITYNVIILEIWDIGADPSNHWRSAKC